MPSRTCRTAILHSWQAGTPIFTSRPGSCRSAKLLARDTNSLNPANKLSKQKCRRRPWYQDSSWRHFAKRCDVHKSTCKLTAMLIRWEQVLQVKHEACQEIHCMPELEKLPKLETCSKYGKLERVRLSVFADYRGSNVRCARVCEGRTGGFEACKGRTTSRMGGKNHARSRR